MNIHIVRRYAAIAATLGALAIGFQNCSSDAPSSETPSTPSVLPPIVAALCEDASDQSTCLTRAKCLHTNERDCTDAEDFVGTDNTLAFDRVAPVLQHPEQTVSLWASISKENVQYQWYKNTIFFNYTEDGVQNNKTEKYFKLPNCNAAHANDPAKLAHNTVAYYYAKATYENNNLKAPFLVACTDHKNQIAGNTFTGLSASDSLSDDGLERQVCTNETCTASSYKTAGDLILLRPDSSIHLRASVDDDVQYKWYYTLSANTDVEEVSTACSPTSSTCNVHDGDSPATGDSLEIEFDTNNPAASACELNKIVYFHAMATKTDDAEYKKQAVFRVACVEAVGSEAADTSSSGTEGDTGGDDGTSTTTPTGESVDTTQGDSQTSTSGEGDTGSDEGSATGNTGGGTSGNTGGGTSGGTGGGTSTGVHTGESTRNEAPYLDPWWPADREGLYSVFALGYTLPVSPANPHRFPSAGRDDFEYSVTPHAGGNTLASLGLRFTPSTRVLSGQILQNADRGQHWFTYTARDSQGRSASRRFRIIIVQGTWPTIAVRSTSFVNCTNSNHYRWNYRTPDRVPLLTLYHDHTIDCQFAPTVEGQGDGAIRYGLTPALPTGLGLQWDSQQRRITGTPTRERGKRRYRYTLTDEDNDVARVPFDIVVRPSSERPQ